MIMNDNNDNEWMNEYMIIMMTMNEWTMMMMVNERINDDELYEWKAT